MKKHLIIISLVIILLAVGLSGCEEYVKREYIIVLVNVHICVSTEKGTPITNESVRVQIIKAGGERLDEVVYTNYEGCTSAAVTFNLYKDQPILAYVYCIDHQGLFQEQTLTWDTVYSSSRGGEYSWSPTFNLVY